MDNKDLRLAVLIDADNAPRTALREIMAEAAVYGVPAAMAVWGSSAANMAAQSSRALYACLCIFRIFFFLFSAPGRAHISTRRPPAAPCAICTATGGLWPSMQVIRPA